MKFSNCELIFTVRTNFAARGIVSLPVSFREYWAFWNDKLWLGGRGPNANSLKILRPPTCEEKATPLNKNFSLKSNILQKIFMVTISLRTYNISFNFR